MKRSQRKEEEESMSGKMEGKEEGREKQEVGGRQGAGRGWEKKLTVEGQGV